MTVWKFQRLGVISLETPQWKCASCRLEGRTSWIFSSCGRCSGLMTGTSGTHSGGLRKGQSPCELLGGFSGFLSRPCRGLRPCVKSLWELPRLGVISLEMPQRKWASSRLEGRTSWIISSCGRFSRLMTGTSGTHSGGLRKGQSPCELLGVLSGFLSR